MPAEICYKIAHEEWEFEAIHRLNHETFAEEIPQHGRHPDGRLVDKFHAQNTYLIALKGNELLGMMALRTQRPFSLDSKLEDINGYLPPGRQWCEVRLLSVKREWRKHGRIFWGLLQLLCRHVKTCGIDAGVISGTLRQWKLYQHMGFVPFGPLVGSAEARFQPMYGLMENLELRLAELIQREVEPANFLPGPVQINTRVQAALERPAISHRSPEFAQLFNAMRDDLLHLTRARRVQVITGSGSTTNDVVAAQIKQVGGRGLIVVMGEFGRRIVRQAQRWQLEFTTLEFPEGAAPNYRAIESALDRDRSISWLWTTHCETSTGILLDMEVLKEFSSARSIKLCLDCMSSIGVVPICLQGVWIASASSGKGLGGAAGIGLIFHESISEPSPTIPVSLDLATYCRGDGIPFTINSCLVDALATAMRTTDWSAKFERVRRVGDRLHHELTNVGVQLVSTVGTRDRNPALHTFVVPGSSEKLGRHLRRAGFWCSFESANLLAANWLQFCLMGEICEQRLAKSVKALRQWLRRPSVAKITAEGPPHVEGAGHSAA